MSIQMMDVLSIFEKKLLLALKNQQGKVTPEDVDMDYVKAMNAAAWLESKGLVRMDSRITNSIELTDEGKQFLIDGLPEKKILTSTERESIKFIEERLGKNYAKIAIGWAKRKGWCDIINDNNEKIVVKTEKGAQELNKKQPEEEELSRITKGEPFKDEEVVEWLIKRGALKKTKGTIIRTIFLTNQGWDVINKGISLENEVSQVTPDIIKSYARTGKLPKLRKYDVHAFAPSIHIGKRHPLTRLIDIIRRVFADMGFTEIKGTYVESCFWNMDALFIPQDHPARDMQDTFYCKKPTNISIDKQLIATISQVHKNGGDTGSRGWNYNFDETEASRLMMRTHSTVNTIRYLAENPKAPTKVFSIERVFRREAIDATHLPEFHQIEGIVHEQDADFSMLKGLLREFYTRMGFHDIRFRPSYYPYTEPSMDVEVRFNDTWLELGGSGIFRPEVTIPFDIKEPVLAWGLGLERLALSVLNLKDIRMLYFSDINWLNNLPLH